MFKLTCDNHMPVNPATKKNKINETIATSITSTFKALVTKVKVQFTTLIVAGNEIIIVIVLYSARLL